MQTEYRHGVGQLWLDLNDLPISDRSISRLQSKFDQLLTLTLSHLDQNHQDFNLSFNIDETIVRGTAKSHFEGIGLPWPIIGCRLRMDFDVNCIMNLDGRQTRDFEVINYEVIRNSHIVLKTEKVSVGEAIVEEIYCFTFGDPVWDIPATIDSGGCLFHPSWSASLAQVIAGESLVKKPRFYHSGKKAKVAFLKLLLPYGSTISNSGLQLTKQAFSDLESELRKQFGDRVKTMFVSRETYVSGSKSRYLKALGLPTDIVGKSTAIWMPFVLVDPDGLGPIHGDGFNAQVQNVTVIRDISLSLDFTKNPSDDFRGILSIEKLLPNPDFPQSDRWTVLSKGRLNRQEAILKTTF